MLLMQNFFFFFQVTPDSQNDFGSYNCTATNMIGAESKEFLLIQAGQSTGLTLILYTGISLIQMIHMYSLLKHLILYS